MMGATVSVHGVRVGQLDLLNADTQHHRFSFDEAWLNDPERPLLGQDFEDRRPRDIESWGLPPWFAHLLPQGPWGRVIARDAGLPSDYEDIELLLAMGTDLQGAVTLTPATPRFFGSGGRSPDTHLSRGGLRFLLSGAQWKLSARKAKRGLVVPVYGEQGQYIAKFPDPSYRGLTRTELAMTRWAQRAGLTTATIREAGWDEFPEIPEEFPRLEEPILLADRFDRSDDAKVHFEDFGQVFGWPPGDGPRGQYAGSAEQLARVVRELIPNDAGEFVDRVVFMILIGNGDAHLKNWGLLYPDRKNPKLSPAYDLVGTVLYRFNDNLALSIRGTKSFHDVDEGALMALAPALGWPEARLKAQLRRARERVLQVWHEDTDLGLTVLEREKMTKHLERTPFARGA